MASGPLDSHKSRTRNATLGLGRPPSLGLPATNGALKQTCKSTSASVSLSPVDAATAFFQLPVTSELELKLKLHQ